MHLRWLEIVKKDKRKPLPVTPALERRGARSRSVAGIASLIPAVLAAALAIAAGGPARADDGQDDLLPSSSPGSLPVICRDQTYGLCAGAKCFVYNDVAYCTCDVLTGNSISTSSSHGKDNICSINAKGVNNGYMASTFSLPAPLIAPSGSQALYVCPRTSAPKYAKCDGAICFTSTMGHVFPGSKAALGDEQIVCSCPVETANPRQGVQIIGPYPCRESFFRYCDPTVANGNNESTLYDGTGIGSTEESVRLLYGSDAPPLNTCRLQ
jgi:hypothetical protein